MSDHFRGLERMYAQAACNGELRPRLHIQDGKATVEIDVNPNQFHAAGAVHGSYYFKLLDDAAFFAANSAVPDVFVLTASFTVNFLRPITQGRIRAVGEIVRPGRQIIFADAILLDEQDEELATGSGVFARSAIPLISTPGYLTQP